MPDLPTLIGYPSGHLPSTGGIQRSTGSRTNCGGVVGGAAGGDAAGVGGGAGEDGAAGSLRRCNAVHAPNAAPLIRASQNKRFSQVVTAPQ